MERISEHIQYCPAQETPLSADIFFIEGEKRLYIYDVGTGEKAREALQSFAPEKERVIILSHYHEDHAANLTETGYSRLLVGDLTAKHLGRGEIVKEPITIEDGIHLEILPCASVHSGGSLILTVNREYAFIGDLIYPAKKLNRVFARLMTETLESLDTEFFIPSHRIEKNIIPKSLLINFLKERFSL